MASDDPSSSDFIALVYDDLRRIASQHFNRETPGHTLQPTAIAHEAYLRLAEHDPEQWKDRSHFLAVAAQCMRRLLVDHARKKSAEKRGGEKQRVTFVPGIYPEERRQEADVLKIHEAIEELAKIKERLARLVELRFFGGLTMAEIAQVLNVSESTVDSDWAQARSWLGYLLEEDGGK